MQMIKKTALVAGLFLCFIVIALSGAGLYLYYHPEQIKPTVESALSTATASSCTIQKLSWSIKPMTMEATDISFKTLTDPQSTAVKIPFIRTGMAFAGPWGRRSLILENTKITDSSMDFSLLPALPVPKKSTFLSRIAAGLVRFFLFRDIRFQSGEMINGQLKASWGDQTIDIRQLHVQADKSRTGDDQPISASFALDIQNSSRNIRIETPNVQVFSGSIFDLKNLALSGTLMAENINVQHLGRRIQKLDLKSAFSYHHDAKNLNIKDFTLHLPEAKIPAGKRDVVMKDIHFQIPDSRFDAEKKSISIPKIYFDTDDLKNIELALDVEADRINLTFQGKAAGLLKAAAHYELLPADWEVSAKDTARIEISGPASGPWQVKAKLALDGLAFKNKTGSLMGEKISLTIIPEGSVDLKTSRMTFAVLLEAKNGEALFDRYYIDLARNPVAVSCNGTYLFEKNLPMISRLGFNLTGILPFEIKGADKQGLALNAQSLKNIEFTVIIPTMPVKPIFQHLVQEPWQTEKPLLSAIKTEGNISAELKVKKSENAWQVKGRIGWRDGALTFRDQGIALKAISLDLPVWYETGMTLAPASALLERQSGRLEIPSLYLPPLPEQPLNLVLAAGPNRISIDAPTVIQVPGGNIRIGAVQVENLFSPDIAILSSLAFDDIHLSALLSGTGIFPPDRIPTGTLTGALNPVRYESHTVTTQGEIDAKIFGGNIIFSDLGAVMAFTSTPTFKLDARWEDIRLAEITENTQFGKIEGVLAGHMTDVEIANGQPQKFNLLMETVKTKGIKQTISIKAVDNIAQIGGGQSPFMGMAGNLASVFEKFPYEKIGIRARLENDVFTVNGITREGGTEYLVKRSGFSGVNIVNQNPNNRISFRDMVKRIQRITHKGGMVVD